MAYDIYGNTLRPGHCEVHPNVHETYPCSVCVGEQNAQEQRRRQEQREREDHLTQQTIAEQVCSMSEPELRTTLLDAGFRRFNKQSVEQLRMKLIKFFERHKLEEEDPIILNHLKDYYLILQVMANTSTRFAIDSEPTRIKLRNLISEIEQKPGREVQEENETEAYQQQKITDRSVAYVGDDAKYLINTIANILKHGKE